MNKMNVCNLFSKNNFTKRGNGHTVNWLGMDI